MSGTKKKVSTKVRAARPATPIDPKLGLPKNTQIIACTSGPAYTLLLSESTPAALTKAILRAAGELRSPLRELLDKRPEYDEALERLLYEDETHDVHDTINELRVRLRELAEKAKR